MCTNFWINPHNGKLPSRLAPAQCQNSLAPQLLSNIYWSKTKTSISLNRVYWYDTMCHIFSCLYTLYGQVSGKSSEVATELSILVSWIATTCGWWKSRKASNSSFLPLMLLIFMLMNFNPLIKLLLFVSQGEDLSFFSFVRGTNQRRNQKSWRIHISGKSMYSLYCSQFHTEFLQWMSIHYGSTYHNCHTELLCDPLEQHHCKDHSQLYSLYNTKLHHRIQFLRVRCH